MKKLMKAVIGDPKTASPAKKYAAYALMVTAVAFVLALVILIVSSIAFAVADGKNPTVTPSGDVGEDLGGATVNKSAITYDTSVTTDDLDAMVDDDVLLLDNRTALDNGLYYGIAPKNTLKLKSSVAKATNSMLVAFYEANSSKLTVSTANESECDLPLVTDADEDGMSFSIERYEGNDKSIADDAYKATYQWIFDNAYSYGFIYTGNSFRYVGVAAATYTRNNAKSIKDYSALVSVLKTNTKSNVSVTLGKTSYQLYYLSADGELKVPTNYVYTVIADGTDGYIITVDMSQKITATTDTDGGVG